MLSVRDCDVFIYRTVFGNHMRYANQSCAANSGVFPQRLAGSEFRIVLIYATRDKQNGEEVTLKHDF